MHQTSTSGRRQAPAPPSPIASDVVAAAALAMCRSQTESARARFRVGEIEFTGPGRAAVLVGEDLDGGDVLPGFRVPVAEFFK